MESTTCTKPTSPMYAVLAYLRKMATAEDAADRRCLVLSDCKPALQQIEAAYRRGSLEGLREGGASPAESCVRRAPLCFLITPYTTISFPSYLRYGTCTREVHGRGATQRLGASAAPLAVSF